MNWREPPAQIFTEGEVKKHCKKELTVRIINTAVRRVFEWLHQNEMYVLPCYNAIADWKLCFARIYRGPHRGLFPTNRANTTMNRSKVFMPEFQKQNLQ